MPLYEYECTDCKHHFEKILKFDDPPPPCPECQGESRKKVSPASFHLKGDGWAKDGYSSG